MSADDLVPALQNLRRGTRYDQRALAVGILVTDFGSRLAIAHLVSRYNETIQKVETDSAMLFASKSRKYRSRR